MKTRTYRLKSNILAVYSDGDERGNLYIPAAASVIALYTPGAPDTLVTVLWQGRPVQVFQVDLDAKAELLPDDPPVYAVSA